MIRAVVGSGGKTSWIKEQAKQYQAQGKKVFVTTSTHMKKEKDTLVDQETACILASLEKNHYAMAGSDADDKIKMLDPKQYQMVCQAADEVLIEADGSHQLPLKFPNENEPVIFDNVEEIIVVTSLLAIGKKVKEVTHRYSLIPSFLFKDEEQIVDAQLVQQLLREGYLKPLRNKYPTKRIRIHVVHDSSFYQRVLAKLMEADWEVTLIQSDWFSVVPKLMLFGGGHVAYEVAMLASRLDFSISVMDDRKEFANRERFPFVDQIICDSFEQVESYLEENAYHVVLTRGHENDFICVKQILTHSFAYLGMIGSQKKVDKTMEQLREMGFSKAMIQRIHAPIGIAIYAQTPAEIAVSILAQIIKEKNREHSAFLSKELSNDKQKGTLCILIDKQGSSPRAIGSMMMVHDNEIVGSIGGGSIENAVIQEARNTNEIMVKEYQLNQNDSANLGMICGGRNRILMIPLEAVTSSAKS